MPRAANFIAIALLAVSCGGSASGGTTTQPEIASSTTTSAPVSTTTFEATTTSVAVTTTTVAPDPLSCGSEEAAIGVGAAPSIHLLTPGLGAPVCARSAIDPTWATLRWPDSPDGDDALLLHLDAGSWVVIEEPPSYEDTDLRTYYFFGCKTPPEIINELSVC